MKILVLGSRGMAGHMIVKFLIKKGYTVDTLARRDATFALDIEDTKSTFEFLQTIKHNYDFIINCIGLLVKDSIDRPDRASIINSWFSHAIEATIKDSKTKLIHLSTDCVFDGGKGNYVENDLHTEINAYGKSKSLGEINNNKDITFRMSIIGPEIKDDGTGLFKWIYDNKDTELTGWENALWNGITTLQLAKCIDIYINDPKITGVYHVVGEHVINKYELLNLINDTYSLGKNIIKTLGPKAVNKILLDTRKEINFNIPDYKTQLQELRDYV